MHHQHFQAAPLWWAPSTGPRLAHTSSARRAAPLHPHSGLCMPFGGQPGCGALRKVNVLALHPALQGGSGSSGGCGAWARNQLRWRGFRTWLGSLGPGTCTQEGPWHSNSLLSHSQDLRGGPALAPGMPWHLWLTTLTPRAHLISWELGTTISCTLQQHRLNLSQHFGSRSTLGILPSKTER